MTVTIKRVYEDPAADDGFRVLVDRLWPRGVSRQNAAARRLVEGDRSEHTVAQLVRP